MADPKFVKLAPHLVGGIVCDIDSGWSVSGADVRPFPDDDEPGAQAFVRTKVVQGVLQEGEKGEYDRIQQANQDIAKARAEAAKQQQGPSPWQEHLIQQEVKAAVKELQKENPDVYAAIAERRDAVTGSGNHMKVALSEEADADRRKELIKEQEETGQLTDDPAKQVERTTGEKPKGGKKSGE